MFINQKKKEEERYWMVGYRFEKSSQCRKGKEKNEWFWLKSDEKVIDEMR